MIAAAGGVMKVELPGLSPWREGKVRSVYEAGPDHLLIVASDRLSAYDSILPTPIPGKGTVLTQLSVFWFGKLASAAPHHFVTADPARYPEPFRAHAALLAGRSMLVRRAERVDIECVVRGHLTGSGWREYRSDGRVCGIALPPGLHDGSRLDPPIFTPATKEESGHDQNVSFDEVVRRVGAATAERLRARSVAIYEEARAHAWQRGLVLADTKFEFGWVDGRVTLIDELLSPDSSRFWEMGPDGKARQALDKQFVRDYLETLDWDKTDPGPELPAPVVARTLELYREAERRLTGMPA